VPDLQKNLGKSPAWENPRMSLGFTKNLRKNKHLDGLVQKL